MFDDILQGVADALGTTTATAGLLISVAIIVSIGLCMTVSRINFIGTIIVLVAVMGLLTVSGWFPDWLMILICIIAAGFFATPLVKWITGEGASGGA